MVKHDPRCAVTRWGDIRSWCDCGKGDGYEEDVDGRRTGGSSGSERSLCDDILPDSSVAGSGQSVLPLRKRDGSERGHFAVSFKHPRLMLLGAAVGVLSLAAYLMARRVNHWEFDEDWWI